MKRIERNKHPRGGIHEWQPLFEQLREALDWALDITAELAGDYDEDVDAVERVRDYLHDWLDGRRVDVDVSDVLTTLAILFAAIEIDLGIDSSPLFTALRRFPSLLHFRGAARDELPTVVIRRVQRRRNGGDLFPLAA